MARDIEELYKKALNIATVAHHGQKRKFGDDKGKDYIVHPIRVADRLQGVAKVAGVLHDVLEDTQWTVEDLLNAGIPKEIIDAVLIVTKKEGDNYFDFIVRIKSGPNDLCLVNQIAMTVKLADLEDNFASLNEGNLKDKYRFAKYILEKGLDDMYEMGFCALLDHIDSLKLYGLTWE